MTDCLFCNIANKTLKTDFVYEDEHVVAFNDIHPQAPIHILIIPKQHIATINDIPETDEALVGHLFTVAKIIAENLHIAADGYRVIMNCNQHGGQAVYHIHLHLLGGKPLRWIF
jgi:histidine triad (HIT) family protein